MGNEKIDPGIFEPDGGDNRSDLMIPLEGVLNIVDELGIYPKSTQHGGGFVEYRTDWQCGWNTATMRFTEKLTSLERELAAKEGDD